jgi:hypothetical protein
MKFDLLRIICGNSELSVNDTFERYAVPGYTSLKVKTVCYHDEGSKKLNACILLLAHMVYL